VPGGGVVRIVISAICGVAGLSLKTNGINNKVFELEWSPNKLKNSKNQNNNKCIIKGYIRGRGASMLDEYQPVYLHYTGRQI